MCGIAGILSASGRPVTPAAIGRMANAIRHRGPDDEGYVLLRSEDGAFEMAGGADTPLAVMASGIPYTPTRLLSDSPQAGANVAMVNRRLAILDLSAAGHQPMSSRDRFGIKPLYYSWDRETFLFASEIKAIVASSRVKARPNEPVIHDYLAYGRTDHSEDTFYQGIRQLRGGNLLELDLRARTLNTRRYYDIPLGSKLDGLSMDEYAGQFHDLLEDSVRLRLISDVPVGSCLSGGLDSSSIVCTVSHLASTKRTGLTLKDTRNSYSARYADPQFDEGLFIDSVVENSGVDPHMTYPSAEGLRRAMDELIWHQDEPFGSTSVYAQWSVFERVSETGVKVVLDGQGADESLAGYLTYHRDHLASLLRGGRLLTLGREALSHHSIHKEPWLTLIAGAAIYSPPAIIGRPLRALVRRRQSNWLDRRFADRHGDRNRHDSVAAKTNVFDHALYRSFHQSLPTLLRYEDRNSMAHSVESRLPFLDYRLVEWVFSTPSEAKIRNGTTKMVLREAMRGRLPEVVRTRQDKMGFGTPEAAWIRHELRDFIVDLVDSDRFHARPYYDHKALRQSLSDHLEGRRNISTTIWTWVNLELWLRMIEDSSGPDAAALSTNLESPVK